MQTTVPSEHQALGRKAKGFNRPKWDERESTTLQFHFKSSQNPHTDVYVRQKPHRRRRQLPQIHQRQRKLLDGQEAARDRRPGARGSEYFLYTRIDNASMLTAISRRRRRIASGVLDSAPQMPWRTEANGARTDQAKRSRRLGRGCEARASR